MTAIQYLQVFTVSLQVNKVKKERKCSTKSTHFVSKTNFSFNINQLKINNELWNATEMKQACARDEINTFLGNQQQERYYDKIKIYQDVDLRQY